MRAFLPVFGIALLVAFWIYALVDAIRTDEFRARGLPKGAWVFIVVILPIIGGILWFTIGKERMSRPGKGGVPSRPVYPDDDPAFLRSVNSEAEREQRIRDLEAQLSELDDEEGSGTRDPSDDPKADDGR